MELTVIIPAFNERLRIPKYIDSLQQHCRCASRAQSVEVIVVDDGSTDDTAGWLRDRQAVFPNLQILEHRSNSGKGAAVRTGMAAAKGDFVLFADADAATPIEEEIKLREALTNQPDCCLAAGTRFGKKPPYFAKRSVARSIQGQAFSRAVNLVFGFDIRDTQCGFKMFRQSALKTILPSLQEDGFLLDIELLLALRRNGMGICEVPVRWSEQAGTKLHPFRDTMRMLTGIARLKRRERALNSQIEGLF